MTNALPPIADTVHLTDALRAAGALDTARVRGVALMAPPIKKLRSQSFTEWPQPPTTAHCGQIVQALRGIGARVWSNNLERIFLAVDDLPFGPQARCRPCERRDP